MSSTTVENIILAIPEVPILHFAGKERVIKGKVIVVSELLLKTNYVELLQYLNSVFSSGDQIFMIPSVDSEDIPLSKMSVEQIISVVSKKQSNEVRSIIPGEAKEHFDTLHASFLSVSEEEKPLLENQIRDAAHRHTLEAIAGNALKKFAIYWEPELKKFVLLLDNRKVFTSDKSRVKTAANRSGNTLARSLLASTATNSLGFTPSGRPRKQIEDTKESGEDSSDDSVKPNKFDSDENEFTEACQSLPKKASPSQEVIEISSGTSMQDEKLPAASQLSRPIAKKSHKHHKSVSPELLKSKKQKKSNVEQVSKAKVKKEAKTNLKSTKHFQNSGASSSSEYTSSASSDSDDSEQVFLSHSIY